MLHIIRHALTQELNDIVLWCPCFIATGILLYFLYIPPISWGIWLIAVLVLFILALLFASTHLPGYWLRLPQILLLVLLGIITSSIRISSVAAPVLQAPIERAWVEAIVTRIQHHPSGLRVWLNDPYIRRLPAEDTPKVIRVVVRSKSELQIGDRVRFLATLMPPKSAIVPGSFDFAEYAYFKQLGAVGAAISKLKVVQPAQAAEQPLLVERLRHFISKHILGKMPQPEAGVAIALLIGDTSYIEPDVANDLRVSGIAHLVAISGMHMVIIISMIFLTSRWLLARSAYICLHYSSKKIAAVLSIIGSFGYLLLAGSPISAQRAFIVASLFLFSIIVDRKATPMRILMISAICLLLATPEALKNPSLQMSFAACIALIASSKFSFGLYSKIHLRPYKFWRYVTGIISSSIIASIATTPFLLYHFNNFSTYGVLTNMIAVPLNDFLIMFLGITGILLIPLGLDSIPFFLMGKTIGIMLQVAHMIAHLEGACIYINGLKGLALVGVSAGGMLLALGRTRLRYAGVMLGVLCVLLDYKPIAADIILPQDGKLFVLKVGNRYYFSNKQGARYAKDVLKQYLGLKEIEYISNLSPQCQAHLCAITIKNWHVVISSEVYVSDATCAGAQIFINLFDDQQCPAARYNVTQANLQQNGAHMLSINGETVTIQTTETTAIDRHMVHALSSLQTKEGYLD